MDVVYFPMDVMRITQGYGVGVKTYSHNGSYALDLGGADGGNDWMFAPCDVIVKRIYGSYNAIWFESLEVFEPLQSKLIFLCLHMNNSDKNALGMKVGKILRTGERMYREGVAGNVTGAHIHFEVGRAPFTGTGWHKNNQGVWTINNQLKPHEVLTIKNSCKVVKDMGYNWKYEKEAETDTMKFFEVFGTKNCQCFNTGNVNDVCADYPMGKLPVGFYPVLRDTGVGSDGFHYWVIYAGGRNRYVVSQSDRNRMVDLSPGDAVNSILAQAPKEKVVDDTALATARQETEIVKKNLAEAEAQVLTLRQKIANAKNALN